MRKQRNNRKGNDTMWVFRRAGDTFTSQFLKVNMSLAGQIQRHNFSRFSHNKSQLCTVSWFCIHHWSPLSWPYYSRERWPAWISSGAWQNSIWPLFSPPTCKMMPSYHCGHINKVAENQVLSIKSTCVDTKRMDALHKVFYKMEPDRADYVFQTNLENDTGGRSLTSAFEHTLSSCTKTGALP